MTVGLLGLQGAFLDHLIHLERCGVPSLVVRDVTDLANVERLIIPGGESTVMLKFLAEFGLLSPLRERIADGMPVWGICAGAIVLAQNIDGRDGPVAAVPISVIRNAYGRQLQSTQKHIDIECIDAKAYPVVFIRAPRIIHVTQDAAVHARCDGAPVFVQYKRRMVTTFHPELNRNDDQFHHFFLSL